MHLHINHLTFYNPEYVKGYLNNPFKARAPDDRSFDPLPIIWLTYSWPEDLITILLTLCHPKLVRDYFINPSMARAPDDNSFDPLPTKNISKVLG